MSKKEGAHSRQVRGSPAVDSFCLDRYRNLVKSYIDLGLYDNAQYWANKVVSLSNEIFDVYNLAKCMLFMKQYHRAIHLLHYYGFDALDVPCHYLTLQCFLANKDYKTAVQLINITDASLNGSQKIVNPVFMQAFNNAPKNIRGGIMYVKGQIFQGLDNKLFATKCYKLALLYDVYCVQALDALVHDHMLSAAEEEELLKSLPIKVQCKKSEADLLYFFYESKLKKYHKPIGRKITCKIENKLVIDKLSTNLDVLVCKAEKLYYNCKFNECIDLTKKILKEDPYHMGCVPIHIACSVELGDSISLFFFAHQLVGIHPESAISWYALGCYFYTLGKYDKARKYFKKAISMDRFFGPAWLAYGHSYAIQNKIDDSLSVYLKCVPYMEGCHLPLLYAGLEFGLTDYKFEARLYFFYALKIAPKDPFLYHEMGVLEFNNENFTKAKIYFKQAQDIICSSLGEAAFPSKWEPLFNNLGHACRKLRNYGDALYFHREALILNPINASTHTAIGFVLFLNGDIEEAITSFYCALHLKSKDPMATTLLNEAKNIYANNSPPFDDVPPETPSSSDANIPSEITDSSALDQEIINKFAWKSSKDDDDEDKKDEPIASSSRSTNSSPIIDVVTYTPTDVSSDELTDASVNSCNSGDLKQVQPRTSSSRSINSSSVDVLRTDVPTDLSTDAPVNSSDSGDVDQVQPKTSSSTDVHDSSIDLLTVGLIKLFGLSQKR